MLSNGIFGRANKSPFEDLGASKKSNAPALWCEHENIRIEYIHYVAANKYSYVRYDSTFGTIHPMRMSLITSIYTEP